LPPLFIDAAWIEAVRASLPELPQAKETRYRAALGLSPQPDFSHGTPPESTIPPYVHHLYNVTHSFVLFLAVFALLWVLTKKPVWELGAWGLHVLVDIPTHSFAFFPTPFLWPLFDWKFDGWQWNQSAILIPNFTVLFLFYGWFLLQRGRPALRPERVRE